MSAQINGITLAVLVVYFCYEGARRLISPVDVGGWPVFATAIVGIGVNIATATLIARAGRHTLGVEGAFQHILSDVYAFIATAVAGLVVALTGSPGRTPSPPWWWPP